MAKTIEEMADNYTKHVSNSSYTREDFTAGAKAILDEIEKFAAATWGDSLTLISLKKKIKELKKS